MIPIEGQPILTAAQMRAAEEAAAPTPDAMYALMERAGAGVADAVRRLAAGAELLVLCGPGTNGGDGYVAARLLREAGHPVRVAASSDPKTYLARAARARWTGEVEPLAGAKPAPVLVDALFGTGLSRDLDEGDEFHLHRLHRDTRLSVAVDLPSGVSTDDGSMRGAPPRFDVTLALGALKPAHLLLPSAAHCGAVRVLDLGVGVVSELSVLAEPYLPEPHRWDHKFSRGMVAVVAGAMPGAAELAARAAAHAGAGYVLLLGASDRDPQAIVRRSWSRDALADRRIGAIVVGPGLGGDQLACERFHDAWATDRRLVIDGDALHLLDPDRHRHAPTILTPHTGEFERLFGTGPGSKVDRARDAARRSGAVVVLKGADTVIAGPGGHVVLGSGASAWLSTAGTGDVLAGACGAMLAAGFPPFRAAEAALWLHTRAARRLGCAFIADDLANELSRIR